MDGQVSHLQRGTALMNRFDRLPIWPFPLWILLVIGVSFFFAFYDMVSIGFAIPVIMKQFHISQATADWSITSGLIGYIIGSFLDARLSDKFGRRISVMLSIAFYAIGSLLMATSTNITWLIIWRLVSGMGLGAEIACCVSYASELSPFKVRGKTVAIAVAFGYFGFACTPYVALAVVPTITWGWRLFFVFGGIFAIVFFFLRRLVPDSPRWYITKGQYDKAEAIIEKAEAFVAAKRKTLLPESEVNQENVALIAAEKTGLLDLLNSGYLKYLSAFVVMWFFYYIGNYGYLTLSSSLLDKLHLSLSHSILLVALESIGFVVGALIAIYLTDRFERKWICFVVALIWAAALFMMGLCPINWVIVVFGFLAALTIALIVPLMYTYTAETFPTRFRATGTSISDGLGHLGGAFCGQIVFFFYGLFSTPITSNRAAMWTLAASGFIAAMALLFGRRTRNRQLEN